MDVNPIIRHQPDPDHPGWWTWDLRAAMPERFHAVVGRLLVRAGGAGRATVRMFPEAHHANLGNMVHGGAILTFIDMALFAGGKMAGSSFGRAVTLDLSTRFISPGRIGLPLDAEVELLRETKRLVFLTGRVVQDGELVAHFNGALRKLERRDPPADRPERGEGTTAEGGDA